MLEGNGVHDKMQWLLCNSVIYTISSTVFTIVFETVLGVAAVFDKEIK